MKKQLAAEKAGELPNFKRPWEQESDEESDRYAGSVYNEDDDWYSSCNEGDDYYEETRNKYENKLIMWSFNTHYDVIKDVAKNTL